MSAVEQLKEQLHHVAMEARQGAGSLGGFRQRFSQSSSQVQALIAGTATHADQDITQLLDEAGTALDHAVQSLEIAAQGCRSYADQI